MTFKKGDLVYCKYESSHNLPVAPNTGLGICVGEISWYLNLGKSILNKKKMKSPCIKVHWFIKPDVWRHVPKNSFDVNFCNLAHVKKDV